MWREYSDFAVTALAVVNGLIAITVALLPMRRSVLKLRLGAAAVAVAALAVGATFYAKVHTYVQIERQQSDRAEVRMRLATFVTEGRGLLEQIKDAERQLPTTAADEWAQRAENFLRDRLGERTIVQFRKDTSELYGDPANIAAARVGYWRAVRNRVVNLEAINAEFGEPRRRP